ncbi:MAG: tetratricopeptide repeat protein [Deltaproteobacteria bacterium]
MIHFPWTTGTIGVLVAASLSLAASSCMTASAIAGSDRNAAAMWLAELDKRVPDAAGSPERTAPDARTGAQNATEDASGAETAERITVDFYKVDLHNVFRLLGQVSGKNIVVDEEVSGTLTLALQDVPWTFVLDVIKNLKELESIERNNTIMIYPQKKKVTWGGDTGATGTLNLRPMPVRKSLHIETKETSKTPIESMVKADALVKKALDAERQGDFASALENYKAAAALWPENTSILKKGATLALGGAKDELTAFNLAKQAFSADPKDAEAASIAAVALARMGKTGEAAYYFDRSMSLDPHSLKILYNYAVFTFSQGRYRDTLRLLARYEAHSPLTPDLMLLKAQSYEHLQNKASALSEYQAVLLAGNSVPQDMKNFARSRIDHLSAAHEKQEEKAQ